MSEYERAIIERFTSVDGRTVRWSAVAKMLGRNEITLRQQYGAIMQPSVLVCEACEPEDHSLKSPHVRPLLKDRILARLKVSSQTAQTLAAALGTTVNAIQDALNRMQRKGVVYHMTGPAPYTWALMEAEERAA